MPGPAARVTDMCAHGGVIMPPGVPTVLIGGMPAATITSMHVCPMVTVLVPHVGGPVLPPGVPTVLIGGMPAATVGDMATCVGPPDVILPPGCPTVLIGTSGGGSGGGAGGAAAAAKNGAHMALVGEPVSEAEGPHWIEYQFVDTAGNPITEVPFEFTGVDDRKEKGVLMKDGIIKRGGIPEEGECNVKLFSVHNAKWSKDSAKVGDIVKLTAEVEGFEDGTKARIEIWEMDIDGSDDPIFEFDSEVKGKKVEEEWEYEYHEDTDDVSEEDERKSYSSPEYYFLVKVGECRARSDLLEYKDWIEIELQEEDGKPVADQEYRMVLSSGEIRKGRLDSNGYAKEENIPPGKCKVDFLEAGTSLWMNEGSLSSSDTSANS